MSEMFRATPKGLVVYGDDKAIIISWDTKVYAFMWAHVAPDDEYSITCVHSDRSCQLLMIVNNRTAAELACRDLMDAWADGYTPEVAP